MDRKNEKQLRVNRISELTAVPWNPNVKSQNNPFKCILTLPLTCYINSWYLYWIVSQKELSIELGNLIFSRNSFRSTAFANFTFILKKKGLFFFYTCAKFFELPYNINTIDAGKCIIT